MGEARNEWGNKGYFGNNQTLDDITVVNMSLYIWVRMMCQSIHPTVTNIQLGAVHKGAGYEYTVAKDMGSLHILMFIIVLFITAQIWK